MSARLPVGVIGVGALGQHHARHLANLGEVHLVGVELTEAILHRVRIKRAVKLRHGEACLPDVFPPGEGTE